MTDTTSDELIRLTQRLLDAIAGADWNTYQELSDPSLTAFEPEAKGQLVVGLPFHHFYFRLGGRSSQQQTTMCAPRVRLLGDVAVVTYGRLVQRLGVDGTPHTVASEETRVWQRQESGWRQVHFHRSTLP